MTTTRVSGKCELDYHRRQAEIQDAHEDRKEGVSKEFAVAEDGDH